MKHIKIGIGNHLIFILSILLLIVFVTYDYNVNPDRYIRGFYINKNGKEVINKKRYTIEPKMVKKNYISIYILKPDKLKPKWGLKDTNGKVIFPCVYDAPIGYFDGIFTVRINNKYGLINEIGLKDITPIKYDYINKPSENLIGVYLNKNWGFIDKSGKEIIPPIYSNISYFSEGLCAVEKGGKWGYINPAGKEIIPYIYDETDSFHEGLAPVKLSKKYGYINKAGSLVIPYRYFIAGIFINECSSVSTKSIFNIFR